MMKIKYASEDEVNDIIELRIEYFKEAYKEFTKEQEVEIRHNLLEYFRLHLGRDCYAVLAIENDKAVSCAILNVISKAPNRRMPNGRYAEIYGVFTQKSKRQNGYATALIKELLWMSHKIGMSFVELEASEDGKPVYVECGFVLEQSGYTKMKYYFNDVPVLHG